MSDRVRDQAGFAVVGFLFALLGVIVVGSLVGIPLGGLLPFGLLVAGGFALGILLVPVLSRRV